MLSATKLAHLKLTHLHTASNALFLSSPPVSAHISSTLSINASKSNIQLSESTWRKTCGACGYAQVPGLTCSVRVRGIGADAQVGWTKSLKGETRSDKKNGDTEVLSGTSGDVEKNLSRRARKRGKRTRGAKSGRRKIVSKELPASHVPIKADKSVTAVSIGTATQAATLETARSRKKPRTAFPMNKEPRMVYSCKICSRKAIHSLPKKPIAVSHDKTTSETSAHGPTLQTSMLPRPLAGSELKSIPVAAGDLHRSMMTPIPTTSLSASTNAAAKKRAKSRKNTLSSMLAQEAANRSAATGNGAGGFGFDLMDFMKTS
ncbi:hypothetical protein TWF225_005122 [Orbilia oligospora]|nr:hypothetical protein TWF751_004159 [Orbilia oligospora]KAF3185740.1 hypothetical protein TWF225_005122 [Orbilia oligospora]KAF3241511.1 hypothetical protein TWF128_010999 [Orbilia oligospora]KAF3296408.1 hypothetical protein TWF132_011002 [Orbilia oligospora]